MAQDKAMYVEDLLIKIRDKLTLSIPIFPFLTGSGGANRVVPHRPFGGALDDAWHTDFIQSVCKYVDEKRPLSTKQAEIVLKIISRLRPHIIALGWAREDELDNLLAAPVYQEPLYESTNVPREVRHLGDNLLVFRCKANRILSDRLKELGNAPRSAWLDGTLDPMFMSKEAVALKPRFDWLYKVWTVPVYRFNFGSIMQLIADERFRMDQTTVRYLQLVKRSFDRPSMFAIYDDETILANICDDPILSGWITEIADGVKL